MENENVQRKQWGVLAGIEHGTQIDVTPAALERQLDTFLSKARALDSEDERRQREAVLGEIDRHAQAWLALEAATTIIKSETKTHKNTAGALGRIYTFGSYALGVSGPSADVDTLLVGPSYIPRAAFFERFPAFLQQATPPGRVTELTCRTSAYVPVISFVYDGVEIDLLYAQACVERVRGDCEEDDNALFDIDKDGILHGMDEKSILSVNGVRATRRILQLVPDRFTFQQTLRYIKVWAKKRALYSNVWGYFGGITWALLTAHVCQLYPMLRSPVQMIRRFFCLYARWCFEPSVPVMLTAPYSTRMGLEVWYPQRRHLAPVLTPSYPCLNSTHNVSFTTRRIIRAELRRAADLFAKDGAAWPGVEAADPIGFFLLYKHYIDIVVASESHQTQLAWLGYVESKLRHLFRNWHQVESIIAHPFARSYREPNSAAGPVVDHFYIGIQMDPQKVAAQQAQGKVFKIDLMHDAEELVELVYRHIPEDKRHPSMSVNLVHLHAYQLPEWVFDDARRPVHTYAGDSSNSNKKNSNKRKREEQEDSTAAMAVSNTTPSPPSSPQQFIQEMAAPAFVPFPLPPPNLPPVLLGSSDDRKKVSQSDKTFVVRTRPTLARKPAVAVRIHHLPPLQSKIK